MSILSTFKKYIDYIFTENGYQLSSRWTKSDAVVMGDGTDDTNTLEKNLGSIQGITDSLTATSSNIALSAKGASDMYNEINSNLGNNLSTRYDAESDTIQVKVGNEWISVYSCKINESALIPLMTSNTTPYNSVSDTLGLEDAYKPFGNSTDLSDVSSSTALGCYWNTNSANTFTYNFELPVNISRLILRPIRYIGSSNYVTYYAVTYRVNFIHVDGTSTKAYEITTTAKSQATQACPSDACAIYDVAIDADNLNVKAIEVYVSGRIRYYNSTTTNSIAGLEFVQVFGSRSAS